MSEYARVIPQDEEPCCLYRHFNQDGVLLYVGISLFVLARTEQHRTRSPWFAEVAYITIERLESRDAALFAEKRAIRDERPKHNGAAGRPPLPDDQRRKAIEVTLPVSVIEIARQLGGGGPRDVSRGIEIALERARE